MLNNSAIQFSLTAILIALCGFFILLNNDEEVGIEVNKGRKLSGFICGNDMWVTIESDTKFVHSHQEFEFDALVSHLTNDFYQHPYGLIKIAAEENVRHDVVVHLTNEIKNRLPDVSFGWESYSQSNKSIK